MTVEREKEARRFIEAEKAPLRALAEEVKNLAEASLCLDLREAWSARDVAGPTDKGGSDARRRLHALYRDQAASGQIDPRLREFFGLVSQLMLRKPNVAEGWREFFESEARRGPKQKTDYRDFCMAVEVERLRQDGMKRDAAFEIVASEHLRSRDVVRNVYERRDKRAVDVSLKMQKLDALAREEAAGDLKRPNN